MGITRMMMKRAITGITMPHRNPIWLRVRRLPTPTATRLRFAAV